MSHDQHFKNLILDYPHAVLAFFAPDQADDGLAGAKVVPVRQEQLKERIGERFRELDVRLPVRRCLRPTRRGHQKWRPRTP